MHKYLLAALFLSTSLACQRGEAHRYLFLGHPYNWANGHSVDARLAQMDYTPYRQVWLGGDVCAQLTQDPATLEHLDSLYDLGSPDTHWAWGNHDVMYGQEDWITAKTGRPSFYTAWQEGICLVVLNTNLFWYYPDAPPQKRCAEKQAQLDMLAAVADTVRTASHLVILHHHSLLNELQKAPDGSPLEAFNINPPLVYPSCDSQLLLSPWLYPRLAQVQRRGVQVLLIGGDLGMRSKAFQYTTPEGIHLLGSGINNSMDAAIGDHPPPPYVTEFGPDQVLVLEHRPAARSLQWAFVPLDSLAAGD